MSAWNFEERRRIEEMEEELKELQLGFQEFREDIRTIKALSKGLLIGVIIAAFLFGYLNLTHLQGIAKMLK